MKAKHPTQEETLKSHYIIAAPCENCDDKKCDGPVWPYAEIFGTKVERIKYLCEYHASQNK